MMEFEFFLFVNFSLIQNQWERLSKALTKKLKYRYTDEKRKVIYTVEIYFYEYII
jgi:hypothetical protein